MENYLFHQVWHLRDGQRFRLYRKVVISILQKAKVKYEYDQSGIVMLPPSCYLFINDTRVDHPSVVISPEKEYVNFPKMKKIYSLLDSQLPPATVMLSTGHSGVCPKCQTPLKNLLLVPRNGQFPLFVGCCGHTISVRQSLKNITEDRSLILEPQSIITFRKSSLAIINDFFPSKLADISFFEE